MKVNALHSAVFCAIPVVCVMQAYLGMTAGLLDLLCLMLMLLIAKRFISETLVVDDLAIMLFLIVVFAIITMVTFRIVQTSWVNVFRSNLFVLVIYLYVINYRNNINIQALKYPFLFINLFNIWVLQQSWAMGFTHHSLDLAYFNLNNIGFLSLIIFVISYALSIKFATYDVVAKLNIIIAAALVAFSFSRANYSMLAIVLVFLSVFVFNYKDNIKLLSMLVVGGICFLFLDIDTSLFDKGLSFLDKKVNEGSAGDMLYERIDSVVFQPIEHYLASKETIFIFLGGGLVPEHSLLITHVTCFGLFSMVLYLMVTLNSIKDLKHKNNALKLSSLLMLLLFLNDTSTNASTYLAFIKLLPFAFLGFIRGEVYEQYRRFKW